MTRFHSPITLGERRNSPACGSTDTAEMTVDDIRVHSCGHPPSSVDLRQTEGKQRWVHPLPCMPHASQTLYCTSVLCFTSSLKDSFNFFPNTPEPRQLSWYSDQGTGWTIEEQRFESQQQQQHSGSYQWVSGRALLSSVKQPTFGADHPPCTAEVKYEWRCTSSQPTRIHGVQSDNSTFILHRNLPQTSTSILRYNNYRWRLV